MLNAYTLAKYSSKLVFLVMNRLPTLANIYILHWLIGYFRSIVLNCLLTHKPSLRAAIQCFLLTAVCNLTNVVGKGSTI